MTSTPHEADSSTGDPALPAITTPDLALEARLRERLASLGPSYVPRTHHLEADGAPRFVNRLVLEASPYLRQHAHNPVNWLPWGEAALARARAEDKPIFLSVGYSTCHWCHVMERESFEDLAIATLLNTLFVCVKVDREERPDVDDLYMGALQMMSGRGGWPMTIVATPTGAPFFAATYVPPHDGARGARMGLDTILARLAAGYRDDRESALARASAITARLVGMATPRPSPGVPGAEVVRQAVTQLLQDFDSKHGGFGRAPKFPQPACLDLLLRHATRTRDARAEHAARVTLHAMARGGIHDHLGGGFHRYSTDARWLVPHFEKMLYDNAQLASTYVGAWRATAEPAFAAVARDVLDYVLAEMTTDEGAFYAATDADSTTPSGESDEGYYFTWTPREIEEALEAAGQPDAGGDAARFARRYGVTEAGNFEGRTVLALVEPGPGPGPEPEPEPEPEPGPGPELGRGRLARLPVGRLETVRRILLDARRARPAPMRDEKVLVAWNALMIAAFAEAGAALDEPRYLAAARGAADFVLARMRPGGRLVRIYADGRASGTGFLDDHAALLVALVALAEATADVRYVSEARALAAALDTHFRDPASDGYFTSPNDAQVLLARNKPDYDGACPSGNSLAVEGLIRLGTLTGDEHYRERAERVLGAFATRLRQMPRALARMARALDFVLDVPLEILVVRPDGSAFGELEREARAAYAPHAIVITATASEANALGAVAPPWAGKLPIDGRTTAYVCERGRCERPTQSVDALRVSLAALGLRHAR